MGRGREGRAKTVGVLYGESLRWGVAVIEYGGNGKVCCGKGVVSMGVVSVFGGVFGLVQ